MKGTKPKCNLISGPDLRSKTNVTHVVPEKMVDGPEVKGSRSDPELGGVEGCTSRSGSGVVFPQPCPCLAFALELNRNITHTPSADPHIAHSCLNKREAEMEI